MRRWRGSLWTHPGVKGAGLCEDGTLLKRRVSDLRKGQKKPKRSNSAIRAKRRKGAEHVYLWRNGITYAQRDQILAAQGGQCILCGGKSRRWVLDKTGRAGKKMIIHGIACHACGATMARIRKRPGVLSQAIQHLKQTTEQQYATHGY